MNSDLSFFPDYIGSYFFSSCHSISNYLQNKYELIQSSDKEQFILHLSHIDEDLLYFYIKRIDKEEGWSTDLKIKLYDLHQKDYLILSLGNSSFAIKEIEIYLPKPLKIEYESLGLKKEWMSLPLITTIENSEKDIWIPKIMKFHSQNPYFSIYNFNYQMRREFIVENFNSNIHFYDKIKDQELKKLLFYLLYFSKHQGLYISLSLLDHLFLPLINYLPNSLQNQYLYSKHHFSFISSIKNNNSWINSSLLLKDLEKESFQSWETYFSSKEGISILPSFFDIIEKVQLSEPMPLIHFYKQTFEFKGFKILLDFDGNKKYQIEHMNFNYYTLNEENNNLTDTLQFFIIHLDNHEEKEITISNFNLANENIKIFKLDELNQHDQKEKLYSYYHFKDHLLKENLDKEKWISLINKNQEEIQKKLQELLNQLIIADKKKIIKNQVIDLNKKDLKTNEELYNKDNYKEHSVSKKEMNSSNNNSEEIIIKNENENENEIIQEYVPKISSKIKILITGGTGLVGHALQKIIDISKYEPIFLSSKDCNLCDYEDTYQLFKNIHPTYVIHLAASVGGLFKNMNQKVSMYEDNTLINLNVLKCCHQFSVSKVISCLSTCIFPDKTSYPINETMLHNGPPHTSNDAYAYAKRMLEVHSKAYQEQYDSNFICVIPTNIYGDHDNYSLEDGHVIPSLIHKCYNSIQNNEDFVVRGTGKPLRQFIHSLDLAKLMLWSLESYEKKDPIILSVDPEDEVSIESIATIIAKTYDYEDRLVFDDSFSDGQFKKTADNTLLRSYLPDYEFIKIEDGLSKTIQWFIDNYDHVRK